MTRLRQARVVPAAAVLAIALLGWGCTAGGARDGETGPPVSAAPPPRSAPSPGVLDEIVLVADLSEEPAVWDPVTEIPFGPSSGELGYLFEPQDSSHVHIPRAFAVEDDGSLWLLDVVKRRVAHYAADGRFLGSIGGLRYDRFHPQPVDIALLDGGLHLLHHGLSTTSYIVTMDRSGPARTLDLRFEGRPLSVLTVQGNLGALIGQVGGYAPEEGASPGGSLGTGPQGFAGLDVGSGEASFLPGMPVGEGRWVDIERTGEQDFELRFATGQATATQPLHVEVVPRAGAEPLAAVVGPGIEVGAPDAEAAGMLVLLAPAGREDARRYGGGRWYLQASPDGGLLVWERLPDSTEQDELQVRHLAPGPGGSVYLMLLHRDRVEILRRSSEDGGG